MTRLRKPGKAACTKKRYPNTLAKVSPKLLVQRKEAMCAEFEYLCPRAFEAFKGPQPGWWLIRHWCLKTHTAPEGRLADWLVVGSSQQEINP
eukprot:1157065-Pelagomonas_calceolata.AAC.25